MNIKKILREKLEAKESTKNNKYEYGCVMIGLDTPAKTWKEIQDEIDEDDIYYEEDNDGYGRENEQHVTILYGIHADVPDEDVEKLIEKIEKPEIELKKVSAFKNDKFDVLKFDVESDDLQKYNKMFKELPHTSKYPDYHPHVTIAYMKPGKTDRYIKLLNERKPIKVSVENVLYSKPDKTKKTYEI